MDSLCPTPLCITGGMNTKKSSLVEEGDLQQEVAARTEYGAKGWQAGARRTGPATQTQVLRGARGTVGEVALRGWHRGQDLGTGKNWDNGQRGRVQTNWGRALGG